MNFFEKIVAFFKKLFGKDVEASPVTNNTVVWAPPPAPEPLPKIEVVPQIPNPREQSVMDWRAYQEELARTGKFPTVPAAPRGTVIPDEFTKTPEGNDAQARLDYLASLNAPGNKFDVVAPEVPVPVPEAPASVPDSTYRPPVPTFRFRGTTECEILFNVLQEMKGQKKAFTYMVNHWNQLGTLFREQAEAQGIAPEDQSRIINHFSNQGKYFS